MTLDTHQLVTREYLDLRLAELRQEMAEMEKRLTNRMLTVVGLATAFISVLMTVFKFLP